MGVSQPGEKDEMKCLVPSLKQKSLEHEHVKQESDVSKSRFQSLKWIFSEDPL